MDQSCPTRAGFSPPFDLFHLHWGIVAPQRRGAATGPCRLLFFLFSPCLDRNYYRSRNNKESFHRVSSTISPAARSNMCAASSKNLECESFGIHGEDLSRKSLARLMRAAGPRRADVVRRQHRLVVQQHMYSCLRRYYKLLNGGLVCHSRRLPLHVLGWGRNDKLRNHGLRKTSAAALLLIREAAPVGMPSGSIRSLKL